MIKTLTSTIAYQDAWMSVRRDEVEYADGTHGGYSVLDRDDFALVIPLERDGFHLVEQYRYPRARCEPGLLRVAQPRLPRRRERHHRASVAAYLLLTLRGTS